MFDDKDIVINYLRKTNLLEREFEFRAVLDHVVPDTEPITMKALTIATVASLMANADLAWPIRLKAINSLTRRTNKQIEEDVQVYDLGTMRIIPELDTLAFVTTIYNVGDIFRNAVKIIEGSSNDQNKVS